MISMHTCGVGGVVSSGATSTASHVYYADDCESSDTVPGDMHAQMMRMLAVSEGGSMIASVCL